MMKREGDSVMMDIQAALSIATRMDRLVRVADRFDYSREDLLDALGMIAEDYRRLAAYTEKQMEQEMG